MKNMPSVMKEMPIVADRPVTGKCPQPERLLPVISGGRDFPVSAATVDSPETFQRMLQKNLQGRDQGRIHEASPGGDRQIEDQDIINAQMMQTGTEAESHKPAGEEPLLDSERLISESEIRRTAKKKISKGQCSVSATNFIISSVNSAPVNEYRDPSLEATVGSRRQPDGHRDAKGGSKIDAATTEDVLSPPGALGAATADAMPIIAESDAAEILPSRGGRRDAFGKAEEPIQFSNRHVDGQAVSVEKRTGIGGSVVTDEMGASRNSVSPDDLGDSMRTTHTSKSRQDNGGKGAAAGFASSLFKGSLGEHAQGVAIGEKVLAPPNAPDAQGADGPVRFRHRPGDKGTALAERGAGSGGRVAAVETGESVKTETVEAFGDATHAVRSGESQQDKGNSGALSGIAPSTLRTGLAERVHPPVTGEKVAPLPSPFAAAVADSVLTAPGFDTGEGISSAGRTVLMTQVIEAAQPLMQHGGGRILISLNPPSLGALDIDVRVKRDSVELFVIANNQDVQQTLCSHVEQLRKALIDQGLNMDRFQVVVGDRSGGQQGRDPRQEGMPGWQQESHSDRGYRPEADGENTSEGMRRAVGFDACPSVGGINLFI